MSTLALLNPARTEFLIGTGTVVNRVAALRFLFVKTLKRHQFCDFLPYPRDPAPAADGAEPGGNLAADQCSRDTVSTDAADDALRHRHATLRTMLATTTR
jgi:hypothetical protein